MMYANTSAMQQIYVKFHLCSLVSLVRCYDFWMPNAISELLSKLFQ